MNKLLRYLLPVLAIGLCLGALLLDSGGIARADPQPEVWFPGTNLPEVDAFYGSAQCPDQPESFYIVAGWWAYFNNRDEVWRYDAGTFTWQELANYPEEMGLPSVVCYQGYLYAAGGNLEGSATSNHFYRYEIATDTWTQLDDCRLRNA